MKRRLLFLTTLLFTTLFLLLLSACAGELGAVPTQPPVEIPLTTPSPTVAPEAPSVIAVFGAEKADAFFEGVLAAAEGSEIVILPVNGGVNALETYRAEDADAAIVFLAGDLVALPQTTIPTYVFAAEGQVVSLNTPHLTYVSATAPKPALDCALSYPPHLAPVRMFGLFSSQSSSAYALWTNEKSNGNVFAKQEYFADSSKTALANWLGETLPLYYPGMLDAIYAESGALAIAAAESLASLGRDDVEVFSAGSDADATAKLSPILICTVGVNLADAGARCYAEAAKLLSGDAAQSGELLPEALWYSEKP